MRFAPPAEFRGLDRRVWLLAVARGVNTAGFSIVMPYLAIYLKKHAGASAGAVGNVYAVSAVVGVRRGETLVDLIDAVLRRDAKTVTGLVGHVLNQPKVSAVPLVVQLTAQFLALAYGRARRANSPMRARWLGRGLRSSALSV